MGAGWAGSVGGSGPPSPCRGLRPARRPAFQNKIVDRCEQLQLQSAAIARHVAEVLPAKDQGVLVSPCPFSQHSVEQSWPHVLTVPIRDSELPGGSSVCRGCPPPSRLLVQVECQDAPAIPASSA